MFVFHWIGLGILTRMINHCTADGWWTQGRHPLRMESAHNLSQAAAGYFYLLPCISPFIFPSFLLTKHRALIKPTPDPSAVEEMADSSRALANARLSCYMSQTDMWPSAAVKAIQLSGKSRTAVARVKTLGSKNTCGHLLLVHNTGWQNGHLLTSWGTYWRDEFQQLSYVLLSALNRRGLFLFHLFKRFLLFPSSWYLITVR